MSCCLVTETRSDHTRYVGKGELRIKTSSIVKEGFNSKLTSCFKYTRKKVTDINIFGIVVLPSLPLSRGWGFRSYNGNVLSPAIERLGIQIMWNVIRKS